MGAFGGVGLIIDEVHVEGTQRSEPESVKRVLKQHGGAPLSPRNIRDDIKRIYKLGLYRDVSADLTERDDKLILRYVLTEKRSVRAVRYEGNDELSEEDIAEVIDVKPYSVLDLPKVNKNADKIKELYIEKGFFLAEVTWDIIELEDNQADVLFRVTERDEIKVAQIQIVGNTALSDSYIKERMETREETALSFLTSAGNFSNAGFERDQMRVTQMYYDQGYMQAVVKEPTVLMSPDRTKLYITLRVDEGPRFKVGLLSVSGELLRPREELEALIPFKQGEWFSSTKVREAMEAISELYKNEGYAYANIIPNTQFLEDLKAIDLDFEVRKGPKVKIGRIEVLGNTTTRDKVIRREMRIAEGDDYSSKLIRRSEQLINRLGFFEYAKIEPARSAEPGVMDLLIKVKEKPTGTFQVGAGFSSIESFVGQAQISQNNLFGRGQNLSLQATFSSLRTMANLMFSDNYFLDSRWQFSANVYRFDTNYFNFVRRSLGGNLTLGYPLTDDLSVSGTYKLEEVSATEGGFGQVSGAGQVSPARLFRDGFTSSLRLSVFYDTRNNRLFPSKGQFISASVEEASELLGSTNEFTRYDIRHRFYVDLGLNMVLKSNVNWGLVTSPSPAGLPIFERYFIGGPMSVRGFFRNSLGPMISTPLSQAPSAPTTSFTVGGTEQLIFNLEYEFPIFQQVGIRGVTFIDGGNAFDRALDYADKLAQFRYAWGFGVRWFSPIGPLRFEWGFPFSPLEGERDSVFEFSIGNFF
jgi:outer membrane protein insertion porin family